MIINIFYCVFFSSHDNRDININIINNYGNHDDKDNQDDDDNHDNTSYDD